MLKKIICLSLILGSFTAANAQTVKGQTLANEFLVKDVIKALNTSILNKDQNCKAISNVHVKITQTPYKLKEHKGRLVAGEWKEIWTVTACADKYTVPVEYTIDPVGPSFKMNPNQIQKVAP